MGKEVEVRNFSAREVVLMAFIQSLGKKEIEGAILHILPPALCLSYHGCIPRLLCVAAYIHHEPVIIYLRLQDPEHKSLTV